MNYHTDSSWPDRSERSAEALSEGGADRADGNPLQVSRREVLGGSLAIGTLLLFGCQGAQNTASLPGPRWPNPATEVPAFPAKPVTAAPTPMPQPAAPTAAVFNGHLLARSQWTRLGVARPNQINAMNGITRLTVHHSGVYMSMPSGTSTVAREIDSIRNGHVGRGWADIGYHYVIDPFGNVWEARSTSYQGAHVEDNNEHNLGVMMLGNFDQQTPTPASVTTLDRFVATQCAKYRIPISRVYTHQELRPTACPGRALQRYMLATRQRGGNMSRLV